MNGRLVSLVLGVAVALANLCCFTTARAVAEEHEKHSCCSKATKQVPAKKSEDCCKGRPSYANDSVKVATVDVSPAVVLPVLDSGMVLDGEHVAVGSSSSFLPAPQPPTLLGLHCALVL